MRHLVLVVLLLCTLTLCSKAYAADFIVYIPDSLVEEGVKWDGFYRRREGDTLPTVSKEQFFLDHCIFNPALKWVRDFFILSASWGKIKSFDSSGITIEIKQ